MPLRQKAFKISADLRSLCFVRSGRHGHLGDTQKELAIVISFDSEKGSERAKVTNPFYTRPRSADN